MTAEVLRATNDELSDLAKGAPELVDADVGVHTGVRLTRKLGVGGMATVFVAERDLGHPSSLFSPFTPQRFAVKIMQPSTVRQIEKLGGDPLSTFRKEVVALGKLSERSPPTPFVVSFYGCGLSDVDVRGATYRLPWLAIEYVDGGTAGTSLTERVDVARGLDPIRALRLVRGLGAGVRALHDAGIIHRDLKPDNVLVAGPIDDEVPKLTDCGIARVDGIATGLAAATRAYAGGEQLVSLPVGASPLIGPWTDVHALSAVVWYLVAGEQWCVDGRWFQGERRSLRTATRMHPGFLDDAELLDRLDAILAKGAAPGVPAGPLSAAGAEPFVAVCKAAFPAVVSEPRRYASVDALYHDLLPVLEQIESRWRVRSARDQKSPTAYRPTAHVAPPTTAQRTEIVRDAPPKPLKPFDPSAPRLELISRRVSFQPDGKLLAAAVGRVVFFIDGQPYLTTSPPGVALDRHRIELAQVERVHYVGELGYALVGPRAISLLRAGQWVALAPPSVPGRSVGDITASAAHRGRLLVVTAETDDSDGAELWSTADGRQWEGPRAIPIGGDVHALAEGPYGVLLVGSQGGKRGRAAFLSPDGMVNVYALGKIGPMRLATAGAERESWAITEPAPPLGTSQIVRFDRSVAEVEATLDVAAIALALDLVGVPWLVTPTAVMRRELVAGKPVYRTLAARTPDRAPFVAIGFTPEGATVVDAEGGITWVEPSDVDSWRRA